MSSPQFVDPLVFRVADLGKTERFHTTVLKPRSSEPMTALCTSLVGHLRFFTRCGQVLKTKYQEENVGFSPLVFGVVTVEELQSVRTRLDQARIVHSGIRKDRYGYKDFIWLDDPDNMRIEFYFRPLS